MSGGLAQVKFVIRNSALVPKRAMAEAAAIKLEDRGKCGADNCENVVGFIGPYSSGSSKALSTFLQVPSLDSAMISMSSTVRVHNTLDRPLAHLHFAFQLAQVKILTYPSPPPLCSTQSVSLSEHKDYPQFARTGTDIGVNKMILRFIYSLTRSGVDAPF